MLNIVDASGTLSYTRKDIASLYDFSVDQQSKALHFIGNPRKGNYIPGYFFMAYSKEDFEKLKQVLTKALFEAQNKQSYEKSIEEGDSDYLAK